MNCQLDLPVRLTLTKPTAGYTIIRRAVFSNSLGFMLVQLRQALCMHHVQTPIDNVPLSVVGPRNDACDELVSQLRVCQTNHVQSPTPHVCFFCLV